MKCKSSSEVAELLGTLKESLFVDWRHNRVYLGSVEVAESAGFNYVTEKNGIMLFRRPKRFANVVV